MRQTPLITALLLALPACGGPAVPDAEVDADIRPAVVAHENTPPAILRQWVALDGPSVEQSAELVRDTGAWRRAWTRAGRADSDVPAVDFETDMVVAVFHGFVRAIDGMDATVATEGDAATLVYNVRGTSGVLSPELHPWGFYVVSHTTAPIRVVCHERAGPGPAEVTEIATLRAMD